MKFQIMRIPWCNTLGVKWTIVPLGDSFVEMNTVEEHKSGLISSFVEIGDDRIGNNPEEYIASLALVHGLRLIADYLKIKSSKWRRDFGQI